LVAGEQSLTYFLTRVQFNWNEVDYSVFSTYYFICNLVGKSSSRATDARSRVIDRPVVVVVFFRPPGIGFTLCVLVKRFELDDRLIGAIGCLSKGLAAFVYAFAPTEFVFYLGEQQTAQHATRVRPA